MSQKQLTSIESALAQEAEEVLAILENRHISSQAQNQSPDRARNSSPYMARSPVRSMLDVDDAGPPSNPSSPRQGPVRSMLDTTSPPPPVIRSMLDLDSAPPPPSPRQPPGVSTTPNSPVTTKASLYTPAGSSHHRSFSDAAQNPVDFGPRSQGRRQDPTSSYQFSGFLPKNTGPQLPKRNTQGGKKFSSSSSSSSAHNALAEAIRTGDLSGLGLGGDRGRHLSVGGRIGAGSNNSKSPHRVSSRSRSPAYSPHLGPGQAYLDDGKVLDINNAYRRLSDAHLAFSGGSLSKLPMRNRQDSAGQGRLVKELLGPDGEPLGSSEDDEPFSSDDEDRGRKKAPRSLNPDARGDGPDSGSSGQRKTMSLLAAAEEDRKAAAQPTTQAYRSLFDEPQIKVTNPSGDNVKAKTGVHPNTSFNQDPGSTAESMIDSDEEADMDDIKRAQKLGFSMTNIMGSTDTHRSIRIINRGEYTKIAAQAEEEHHRLRKYLVATDLSEESTHALEWAIGTVLRDGDTLIAIYCVDEETGIVKGDGAWVPDDPKAIKEQATAINTVANTKDFSAALPSLPDFKRASALQFLGDSKSNTPNVSPGPSGRSDRGRAEEERRKAVEFITSKLTRLLRKTRLQVRVIVEVIHCKNPKHLITEVIDVVEPTLVVIGSRGRSAIKGVILGSFSNYLVTKSSVPVMVARKRLRKQKKYSSKAARQVNNLSNPAARSLANAKID